ncbi:hypothetical protein AB0K75_43430, partial [Streptomyces sp. NPDC055692]
MDRFLSEVAAQAGHSVLPLLDFEGRPSGVVRHRLAAVPSGQRPSLRVRHVATPLSQCTLAAPDDLLISILERLGSGGGLPIPSPKPPKDAPAFRPGRNSVARGAGQGKPFRRQANRR